MKLCPGVDRGYQNGKLLHWYQPRGPRQGTTHRPLASRVDYRGSTIRAVALAGRAFTNISNSGPDIPPNRRCWDFAQ
jgi:hypothetical protein